MGASKEAVSSRALGWKAARLPAAGGDPLPDCRAQAKAGHGGYRRAGGPAAAACVGARSVTRGAGTGTRGGWTWQPLSCPSAPMPATPATPPMARTTSPLAVSEVSGEPSFLLWGGGGKQGGYTPEPNCSGNFITVHGDQLCIQPCPEGEVSRGRRGRSTKRSRARSGQGWWPAPGRMSSPKEALQKKIRLEKQAR